MKKQNKFCFYYLNDAKKRNKFRFYDLGDAKKRNKFRWNNTDFKKIQ
jgi:hypothetical protein